MRSTVLDATSVELHRLRKLNDRLAHALVDMPCACSTIGNPAQCTPCMAREEALCAHRIEVERRG